MKKTTSKKVIKTLKSHFARYGIPNTVVSDNGPQFQSSEFKNFSKTYEFTHTNSDPYNAKSNGKAESAVKSAKNLLRKNRTGDQFLALLNFRNTPSANTNTSPAQKFLNRRTRTLLPLSNKMLSPKICIHSDKNLIKNDQEKQKKILTSTQKHSNHYNQATELLSNHSTP